MLTCVALVGAGEALPVPRVSAIGWMNVNLCCSGRLGNYQVLERLYQYLPEARAAKAHLGRQLTYRGFFLFL